MSGLLQTLDVSSDSLELLALALQFPWRWDKNGATHYETRRIDATGTHPRYSRDGDVAADVLILHPFDTSHRLKTLPFPLRSHEMMYDFVKGWLRSAAYGLEPDTDGSTSKGWRVLKPSFPAIVRVQPEWIVYGK